MPVTAQKQAQRVLCMSCGDVLDAETGFAPKQLKSRRPRCRACTGGSGQKFKAQAEGGRASKAENRRAQELQVLERAGIISELREQVRYELIPAQEGERAVTYVADFVYKDAEGKLVVEDTKGFRTPVFILKRKLMQWRHGIRVVEIRRERKRRR